MDRSQLTKHVPVSWAIATLEFSQNRHHGVERAVAILDEMRDPSRRHERGSRGIRRSSKLRTKDSCLAESQ